VRRHIRWLLRALAPRSIPVLAASLAGRPELLGEVVDALGYTGPAAAGAVRALLAARSKAGGEQRAAIDGAPHEIRGPFAPLPERPISYLGEAVRTFVPRPRERRSAPGWTRRWEYERRLWGEMACERYEAAFGDGVDLSRVGVWGEVFEEK